MSRTFLTAPQIPNGAGAGKVLTSDASGNGAWASPVTGFVVPTAKTTTYTAAANDMVIATSGTFTVTSPAHSNGRFFSVHNKGTGVITVSSASGSIFGPGLQSGGVRGVTSITLAASQDAHVLLMSDGTSWYVVDGGQQTAWTGLTYSGTWVDFGAGVGAQYMKDPLGFVHLRGLVKSGTVATTIGTLPAGFRPGNTTRLATHGSGGIFGQIDVNAAGAVIHVAGGNTDMGLDVAPFLAEN